MYELIRNIGLGLFVNGSYDLLHFDINLKNIYITTLSIIYYGNYDIFSKKGYKMNSGEILILILTTGLAVYSAYLLIREKVKLSG